ncbi:hypothetical protein TraAM80_03698 [Trypanosoma rangeli]|uniref:Uncharacterized protein n=1 Tax=Trypanosoma rangeli TaxID=5698 RepID=A0A3R7M0D9_TRYRA|nr:uncharacterized protein TraAM80_03698 [Trypanosoma rangeli]RNF06777.1 hypothetical protein TraAM80_03698 [Trypanosoma rangeli]|eukprot:RNF06777.1 hypothetical protein TraAM80_03698 [Trypanosoma rangeli]
MLPKVNPIKSVLDPATAETHPKGTNVSGSVDMVECGSLATARRENTKTCGGLRSPVHPAYTAMEQAEMTNVDDFAEQLEGCNIQVQVRTRGTGRRSPLVAMLTHSVRGSPVDLLNSCGSGISSPMVDGAPGVGVEPASRTGFNTNALLQDPLPSTVVHRALHGKCRFIQFPQLAPFEPPPQPPARTTFPLFVGQVRFETTQAELIWLIRRTSGACVLTVEGRGSGCFIMHLQSEAERGLVRQLHKRILFDIGGAWFARSSEEVDGLCEYVALRGPYLSKQAKLPRDAMVVEDIKVDSTDMGSCHPCCYSRGTSVHSLSSASTTWESPNNAWVMTSSSPLATPLP